MTRIVAERVHMTRFIFSVDIGLAVWQRYQQGGDPLVTLTTARGERQDKR
jgi:hypothetical protein